MIDKSKPDGGEFTTVIGADAVFKGELSFDKGVRVDGRVEGKISTKGRLAISQGGTLQADVDAGAINVEGTVNGNLTAADRVELRQSARLKGDIRATKLLVAEGATFIGQCNVGPDAAKGAPPAAAAAPGQTNRITQKEGAPSK
jgi:cytoskeletal protein CcmA (bactofilin family)